MVAALPFSRKGPQNGPEDFFLRGIIRQREGFPAGEFEQLVVAQWICNVKTEVAGLAGAEKFAGAAKQQIGLGDFEAVGSAHHGLETRAGFVRHVPWRN